MSPKSSNGNSAYKSKIKLDSEKLKNDQVQPVKVDLTKGNIRTLAKHRCVKWRCKDVYGIIGTNKDIMLYVNDTNINVFLKGDIDMSTTTSETAEVITDSDEEVVDLINVEQDWVFIIDK